MTLIKRLSPLFITLIIITYTRVEAFPTGATIGACDGLAPNPGPMEHNALPQVSPFPYDIECMELPNRNVNMTVRARNTGPAQFYKGLLAQLRDDNDMPVGRFIDFDSNNYQLLCDGDQGITHTNDDEKTMATFEIRNNRDVGNLRCVVTVVMTRMVYWVQGEAPVQAAAAVGPPTRRPPTRRPTRGPPTRRPPVQRRRRPQPGGDARRPRCRQRNRQARRRCRQRRRRLIRQG